MFIFERLFLFINFFTALLDVKRGIIFCKNLLLKAVPISPRKDYIVIVVMLGFLVNFVPAQLIQPNLCLPNLA